jgi:hypothetical protein
MTAQLTLSQAPKVGTTWQFPAFEDKNPITTVPLHLKIVFARLTAEVGLAAECDAWMPKERVIDALSLTRERVRGVAI